MNQLDNFSKRMLIIAISISIVLLSLSAFLLTIHRVNASPKSRGDIVGLGIDRGYVYYGSTGSDGNYKVQKVPAQAGTPLR